MRDRTFYITVIIFSIFLGTTISLSGIWLINENSKCEGCYVYGEVEQVFLYNDVKWCWITYTYVSSFDVFVAPIYTENCDLKTGQEIDYEVEGTRYDPRIER